MNSILRYFTFLTAPTLSLVILVASNLNATEDHSSIQSPPCQKILADVQAEILQPLLPLSLMRCYAEHNDRERANIFAWEVFNAPFWSSEVLALQEAAGYLEDKNAEMAIALVSPSIQILQKAAHRSDRKRREAHAFLLGLVFKHGPKEDKANAHKKIYVELGDTDYGKKLLKKNLFKANISQKAQRIENLARRHENRIILKEGPRSLSAEPLDANTCVIAYQIGKSGRKKRRYKTAHKYLDRVLKECKGDSVRKALYMKSKVSSFQSLKPALEIYNRFLAEFSNDPLADDVMMMKALHLENKKQTEKAVATYRQLLSRYEDGDQWNKAAFRLAFALARAKDTQAAIEQLDALARKSGLDSFTQDRALYWRARLKIYPQLKTLEQTQSVEQKEVGRKELLALSQNRMASYYGHLALRLLNHGHAQKHFEPQQGPPSSFIPFEISEAAEMPQLDQNLEELHLVQQLISKGYRDEAIWVLDRLQIDGTIPIYQKALGYFLAGAFGKSHRILRTGHLHWPHGKPVADTLEIWQLVFPQAYRSAFQNAAQQHGLPQSLLWGLSREESAFEKDVTSWAGARGLCQLMPATAKEEAQIAKMELKDLNQLFEPRTNTLLGAQHLKRRLDLLHHPFLAVAAYNAGPGNVRKWRKALKDYQAIDAFVEAIPVNQTRNYVRKVVGSWITYAFFTAEAAQTDFSLILPPK